MIPLHPPLSGMPLAFVVLLALVELCRLSKKFGASLDVTRRVLLLAVVCSTVATFLSGYQASSPLGDLAPEVGDELGSHHAWGRILMINSLVMGTLAWIVGRARHGKGVVSFLYFATLVTQVVLTLYVGSLGGTLVFERGLGVAAR